MSTETLVENKLSSISALKTGNEVDLVRSYLRERYWASSFIDS